MAAMAAAPTCAGLTDVEHVVFLIQENRSFDHYFGRYPGVRGFDDRSVRLSGADDGTTVFLSSHSLDVVEELADRIAIVDHGRLISCGSLEHLRKHAELDGSLEDVFLRLTEEVPVSDVPAGAGEGKGIE